MICVYIKSSFLVLKLNVSPYPTQNWHFLAIFASMSTSVRHIKISKKVQVGKDQEKAQSEKDSHSKNRGGKKPN